MSVSHSCIIIFLKPTFAELFSGRVREKRQQIQHSPVNSLRMGSEYEWERNSPPTRDHGSSAASGIKSEVLNSFITRFIEFIQAFSFITRTRYFLFLSRI
jgi:hypothetical protein